MKNEISMTDKVKSMTAIAKALELDLNQFYSIRAAQNEITFQGDFKPSIVRKLKAIGDPKICKINGYLEWQYTWIETPVRITLT